MTRFNGKQLKEFYLGAKRIMEIIETAENRAMASDGPVPPTEEMMHEADHTAMNRAVQRIVKAAP